MKYTVSLVLLVVVGVARAQNDLQLDTGLEEQTFSLNKRVTDDMLQKCIDNGDTQALQRARASAGTGEACFMSVKQRLLRMLQGTEINERRDLEEPCRIMSTHLLNCSESFYADVYPCYSDRDIAALNVTQRMGKNFIEYVCGPELRIYDLSRMTPLERLCISLVGEDLAGCVAELVEESENNSEEIFRKTLEPRGCRQMKQAADCAVRHLEFCNRPSEFTAVDVVIGSIQTMVSAIPPCPEEELVLVSDNAVETFQV